MSTIFPLLGLARWPLTLGAAVLVFGASAQGTLGLISDHFRPSIAKASASMPTPAIIKMPAPVIVTDQQADARLSVLSDGRSISGGVTTLPTADDGGAPTMRVNTPGLAVRSHPFKGSPQVGTLKQGATVEIRSKQGGWMLVDTSGGATGWVFGKYLTLKPAVTG